MLETSQQQLSNTRAPLLWLLCPLLFGYTIGRYHYEINPVFPAGIGLTISILIYGLRLKLQSRNSLYLSLFCLSGFFLSWSYYIHKKPEYQPYWEQFPPREGICEVRIKQIFDTNNRFKRVSGIAEIISSPNNLPDISGHHAYFQLINAEQFDIYPSSQLRVRSVISLNLLSPGESKGFEKYLLNSHVYFSLRYGKILELSDTGNPFYRYCKQINQYLEETLRLGSPEKQSDLSNIYTAILLGKKSVLSKELKQTFINTGTMHFFAISGLHIGIIAGTLFILLKLLRIPTTISAILGLSLLLTYVYATGFKPSAVRAFTMIAFFWLGSAIYRKNTALSALAASALLILIISPTDLWNPGFQLSYIVVIFILLYGLPLSAGICDKYILYRMIPPEDLSHFQKAMRFGVQYLISAFCISFAAILGSTPLVILYFETWASGSIILNIILLPLVAIELITGLLSIFISLITPQISEFINHAAWIINLIILKLTIPMEETSGSFHQLMLKSPWVAVLYFCASGLILMRPGKHYIMAPILLALMMYFGTVMV